jgi:acyl carrier protein phosphodiesterase
LNYLAHLFLAAPTDASRIGNLLGDFVKGTPESLAGRFPPEVLDGIVMHRRLDRFTDDHPSFFRARDLLAPERRRFAGIVVDIFFDHFLIRHWDRFASDPLPEFVRTVYATLDRHPDWLGETLAEVARRMREEHWLASYRTIDGLALTLERIARRSPRTAPIRNGTDDLEANYAGFENAFLQFFPDARARAAALLAGSAP